jgi:hypothetical protein
MALSAARSTPERAPGIRSGLMAASLTVYQGGLLMRNAAGYVTKGATATGSVGIGRAEEGKVNSGSAGAERVDFREGTFRFKNSASSDEITVAQIGDICWIVDDETVAKTDGSAARSPAGFVVDVDAQGVWVRFDEVLARLYVEGVTLPA